MSPARTFAVFVVLAAHLVAGGLLGPTVVFCLEEDGCVSLESATSGCCATRSVEEKADAGGAGHDCSHCTDIPLFTGETAIDAAHRSIHPIPDAQLGCPPPIGAARASVSCALTIASAPPVPAQLAPGPVPLRC